MCAEDNGKLTSTNTNSGNSGYSGNTGKVMSSSKNKVERKRRRDTGYNRNGVIIRISPLIEQGLRKEKIAVPAAALETCDEAFQKMLESPSAVTITIPLLTGLTHFLALNVQVLPGQSGQRGKFAGERQIRDSFMVLLQVSLSMSLRSGPDSGPSISISVLV